MANKGSSKVTPATVSSMLIYKAEGDTEPNEGRGPHRTIGYFLDEAQATRAAKGEGVMGNDGYVSNETAFVVVYHDPDTGDIVMRKLGPVVRAEFEDPKEIRAKALAKLTEKEKKALGLR